jgi:PAS domain S-box-containing protein
MFGKALFDFMDDVGKAEALRLLERRRQGISEQHDFRFKHRDGSDVWVTIATNPLYDAQGRYRGTLGMITDVSERKRAEDALRRSEARLRSLVESQTTYVIRTDLQGYITYANPRFLERFDILLENVVGSFALDTIVEHDWDNTREVVQMCLLHPGESVQIVLQKQPPHQPVFWSLWEFVCLVDVNGKPSKIQCIGVDISEQVKAEEALRQSQAEQERLSVILQREQEWHATINRMMKVISHELRTPLTAIKLACEFVRRHDERLDSSIRLRKIQSIDEQTARMNHMIDEVMQVVRGMFGGMQYQARQINLERLCQMSVDEMQDSLGSKHHLRFISDGHIQQATVDETLLSRILVNLLTNAIRYSPEGSAIRLELRQDGSQAVLSVSDEGIGIAPEDLDRIFEPFFRAANAHSINGTGLGLSIVQDCVKLHGGTISVDSAIGQGSTFTVRLPLA